MEVVATADKGPVKGNFSCSHMAQLSNFQNKDDFPLKTTMVLCAFDRDLGLRPIQFKKLLQSFLHIGLKVTPKQHLPKNRGTAYSVIDLKSLKRVFNFIFFDLTHTVQEFVWSLDLQNIVIENLN